MANPLLAKLIKASYVENVNTIADSEVFVKTFVPTVVPMINVALSGRVTGGLSSGLTAIAGESKSFKTMFMLIMIAAYLNAYPDAIAVFYDSEFGTPPAYMEMLGIDTNRVIHVPVKTIEELNFDLVEKLEALKRGDKVFIAIDSIGNLASKKERQDALDQKSVLDMTRAKALKSMFRIVTPYFGLLDIPGVFINHVYEELGEMYPKTIMTGGGGPMLAADTVWIVTKSKEKEGEEHTGYHFNIRIEKSRFVREGSRIPITVNFDKGINKWSGFFDLAKEMGYITMPKSGWYQRNFLDKATGAIAPEVGGKLWQRKQTDTLEFWEPILKNTNFIAEVESNYILKQTNIISDDSAVAALLSAPEDTI